MLGTRFEGAKKCFVWVAAAGLVGFEDPKGSDTIGHLLQLNNTSDRRVKKESHVMENTHWNRMFNELCSGLEGLLRPESEHDRRSFGIIGYHE